MRAEYARRMEGIRRGFEADGDGLKAAAARASLVDEIVTRLWAAEVVAEPKLAKGAAVAAVGGYGRAQLFPHSDIDLLFCVEKNVAAAAKAPIRRLSQLLWDCGLQVAMSTRQPSECERFEVTNPEFGLSMLDVRGLCGDAAVLEKLTQKCLAKMLSKDTKALAAELARLTRERHGKYGNTLFHLEPNIKDCPGGLRDANVCHWMAFIRTGNGSAGEDTEFRDALAFMAAVRTFLHYRHERDDNTLDWQAQDAAAEQGVGLGARLRGGVDAAYWMRAYFRYARILERCLLHEMEAAGWPLDAVKPLRRVKLDEEDGIEWSDGRLALKKHLHGGANPAHEPEIVLRAFAVMAATGARLTANSEARIADAIPLLSAVLEEGPALWRQLEAVLLGPRAAAALRTMHTLGVLELILPEFHGIDALVIRDAYHRYTVDEHTFVLIETLHGLAEPPAKGAPEWRLKFHSMVKELQSPGLLYLAALMHDTGKGRAGGDHATLSAQMTEGVLRRLEMDSYEAGVVTKLIELHLEMSAALRRDIFDAQTVRAFAGKVQTHELLRMLTLFTYADIAAVHPDAMTPWKAENLWRLSMAASNQLDRNVDEERVHTQGVVIGGGGLRAGDEKIARVVELLPGRQVELQQFLEGFPERYIRTRSAETIRQHFLMTRDFAAEPFQIAFQYGITGGDTPVSEITLVTQDRPRLFAGMAAALAAWGMNVVTADAFANSIGVVVDSFRFTDTFRTLELNESERERFVASVRELVAGRASVEKMLSSRRRSRRKAPKIVVETKIEFDDKASSSSTLMQVVAQDVPGLLRTLSATVSELGYNVEVALVDTEGETAIDVFYLTRGGMRLSSAQKKELRDALAEAIQANAGQ